MPLRGRNTCADGYKGRTSEANEGGVRWGEGKRCGVWGGKELTQVAEVVKMEMWGTGGEILVEKVKDARLSSEGVFGNKDIGLVLTEVSPSERVCLASGVLTVGWQGRSFDLVLKVIG